MVHMDPEVPPNPDLYADNIRRHDDTVVAVSVAGATVEVTDHSQNSMCQTSEPVASPVTPKPTVDNDTVNMGTVSLS